MPIRPFTVCGPPKAPAGCHEANPREKNPAAGTIKAYDITLSPPRRKGQADSHHPPDLSLLSLSEPRPQDAVTPQSSCAFTFDRSLSSRLDFRHTK